MKLSLSFALLLAACGSSPPSSPTPTPPQTQTQTQTPAPAAAPGPVAFETEAQKTVYALGQVVGQSLVPFQLSAEEVKVLESGLDDALSGRPAAVDPGPYQEQIQALLEARTAVAAAANKEKSKAFLAQIASTPGAAVSPSGLVFVSEAPGAGAQPAATDVVQVNYRGTLSDGHEFDSSYASGQPATFRLDQVVPCWTEGIQKMKVGGKAKLGCPSDLAYGDQPNGDIPAGSALLFEVELLKIDKP